MKAVVKKKNPNSESFILALKPETEEEKKEMEAIAEKLIRPHIISCRGFKYLDPQVEFLIQPMPKRD